MNSFWEILLKELTDERKVILMYVLHSEGSSPGRQGFKMMVSSSGLLLGSIGGGFMEHKLVELCKKELLQKDFNPFLKRQIHQSSVSKDKSGMICSGEQTIAFYQLEKKALPKIRKIVAAISTKQFGILNVNESGINFIAREKQATKFEMKIVSESDWQVKEDVGFLPELHIVGGGHVGLALSKFAYELGFKVVVYDDRHGLNTVKQNEFGESVIVNSYENIADYIISSNNKYVVLMSFGFRTDKVVLKQLINHDFKYLGMMGSKEKVKQLYKELLEEGVHPSQLDKVYSPIGIQIKSETPAEIAISILAEIITIKNGVK